MTENGKLKKNRPFDEHSEESIEKALDAMDETCSLDVAEDGEQHPAEVVGKLLGITRERAHADQESAMLRLLSAAIEFVDPGDRPDDPYFARMGLSHASVRFFKMWFQTAKRK